MSGALKPGFCSLATLKLVVNIFFFFFFWYSAVSQQVNDSHHLAGKML